MDIYIKSEPSGEYGIGSITKEELEKYGIIGDKEFDENFESELFEFTDFIQSYGIATNPEEMVGLLGLEDKEDQYRNKIIENSKVEVYDVKEGYDEDNETEIIEGLQPGYYVLYSAPSKYSCSFDLPYTKETFDPEKLKLEFQRIVFPCLTEDSYGEVDITLLTDIEYDGETYRDEYYDSFVDRGYEYEYSVIQVKEDKSYEIIRSNV